MLLQVPYEGSAVDLAPDKVNGPYRQLAVPHNLINDLKISVRSEFGAKSTLFKLMINS